jgi:shikimate kinase
MGHLWLIGMMGAGKTTVGVIVAERLLRPFIDIDAEVMRAAGRTIPELFREGEEIFRREESAQIALAASLPDHVIATGGGAVLASRNLDLMRETGLTVLLTATVDTIMARIGHTPDRPLATDRDTIAAIADLRLATYIAAADHVVDTNGKAPTTVAEEVFACAPM